MSRSKKKVAKTGICTGNNTEYYRLARRQLRRLNNSELSKLQNKSTPDEIDEQILTYQKRHCPAFDEWDEPTDGSQKRFNRPQEHQYRNNPEKFNRLNRFWQKYRRK